MSASFASLQKFRIAEKREFLLIVNRWYEAQVLAYLMSTQSSLVIIMWHIKSLVTTLYNIYHDISWNEDNILVLDASLEQLRGVSKPQGRSTWSQEKLPHLSRKVKVDIFSCANNSLTQSNWSFFPFSNTELSQKQWTSNITINIITTNITTISAHPFELIGAHLQGLPSDHLLVTSPFTIIWMFFFGEVTLSHFFSLFSTLLEMRHQFTTQFKMCQTKFNTIPNALNLRMFQIMLMAVLDKLRIDSDPTIWNYKGNFVVNYKELTSIDTH